MRSNVSILGGDGSTHKKDSFHTCDPLDLISGRLHGSWEGVDGAEEELFSVSPGKGEQHILLDILILDGHFIHSSNLKHLPWVLDCIPSLLRIVLNPFLQFVLLVLVKKGTLPPHHHVVKEHTRVVVLFLEHK